MSQYSPEPKVEPVCTPRTTFVGSVNSYIGSEGLVGAWLLFSGGGRTAWDCSGEENHGSISGARWTDEGITSWALDFTDDYVELPAFPTFSEFTAIIWSYHRSVNDGDTDTEFRLSEDNGIVLRDDGAGTEKVWIYDGGWTSVATSIANDTWNMWTERYDGATMTAFKNDASFGTYDTATYTGAGDGRRYIGCEEPGRNELNGLVGMVWLYDVSKSDAFISEVYEETRKIFGV